MIRSIITFSIIIAVCILTPQQSSGQNRFIRHGFHAGIGVAGSLNRFQLTAERTTNQYTEQKIDRSFSVLGNVFAGYGQTLGKRLFWCRGWNIYSKKNRRGDTSGSRIYGWQLYGSSIGAGCTDRRLVAGMPADQPVTVLPEGRRKLG